jgi:hypothetical protein
MEWTSTAIRIWAFPRGTIPASITAGTPNTAEFGIPSANFYGDCDIDAHFCMNAPTAGCLFDADCHARQYELALRYRFLRFICRKCMGA